MLIIKLKEKWKLYLFHLLNLKEEFKEIKKLLKSMLLQQVKLIVQVKKELILLEENNFWFFIIFNLRIFTIIIFNFFFNNCNKIN